MNTAETNIMEMLHRQASLARSKEMFIHRLPIQGPQIDITAGIRYNHIGPTCYITFTDLGHPLLVTASYIRLATSSKVLL